MSELVVTYSLQVNLQCDVMQNTQHLVCLCLTTTIFTKVAYQGGGGQRIVNPTLGDRC